MLTRTPTTTARLSQRALAQRRLRRSAAARRPFCSTNGCTTYLEPDIAGLTASCPICGSRRALSARSHA